jgi:integrase/recombinase XerD
MAAPRELDLSVTLDAAWRTYEKHLLARVDADTFSAQSARGYLAYSRRIVDHLGPERTCDSVEASEIVAWLAHYRARGARRPTYVQKGAGPATLRHCHKSAKGLFAFADANRWLRENPMRDVAAPPLPRKTAGPERAALSRPELEALIAAARTGHGSYHGDRGAWVRDEIVIRLTGESGLRNGDVQNLDLGDIEMEPSGHWVAQIRRGKGRKARTVPLTDTCATLIRDYIDQWRPQPAGTPDRYDKNHHLIKGDAHALLLSPERHRFNAAMVRRIVDRCAQSALGRHYVPHGLRHTTGTLLAREAKADPALIAHILGHSDISVTSVYLDTTTDEAAAAVNRRKVGAKAKAPKELPPSKDDPRWSECGTREGWNRHKHEHIPRCAPCRMWKREDAQRGDLRKLERDLARANRILAEQAEQIRKLREQVQRRAVGLSTRPRGRCPVCTRLISVTEKGVMRVHQCSGTGQPPLELLSVAMDDSAGAP